MINFKVYDPIFSGPSLCQHSVGYTRWFRRKKISLQSLVPEKWCAHQREELSLERLLSRGQVKTGRDNVGQQKANRFVTIAVNLAISRIHVGHSTIHLQKEATKIKGRN
ncbi:hypothetical protein CDL15_Pgr016408 [Punica granatum]|uniref:Uncharacterized protein n=1 Tax=Punica granatum TaxID=22663 RepID=A0A218XTX6_PUNGR|nr:hypothetical protein CDL15_Pgr016408 [Punica granatum]